MKVPAVSLLLASILLLAAGSLDAQDSTRLMSEARQIAGAWAGGADRSVTSRLAPDRVSLHLEGTVSASLPTRHATAALREYLRGHQPGEATIARVTLVEGSGERGFVELQWTTRRAGTSQTLRRTVFLGLRQEQGRWLLDEIRVMP
jgi:hypothetical protein